MEYNPDIGTKEEMFELEERLKKLEKDDPGAHEEYFRLLGKLRSERAKEKGGKPDTITAEERLNLVGEAIRISGIGSPHKLVDADKMQRSFEKYGCSTKGMVDD